MALKDRAMIKAGIDDKDSLKTEKAYAAHAAYELLVAQTQQVRDSYRKRIINAKTSGEICQIMKEVRDII